jgi:hypothetical protein
LLKCRRILEEAVDPVLLESLLPFALGSFGLKLPFPLFFLVFSPRCAPLRLVCLSPIPPLNVI